MTIQKEFEKAIHESTMSKYGAEACYEIHKRELEKQELKLRIELAKIKGEMIGTLKAFLLYNISEKEKETIEKRLKELGE